MNRISTTTARTARLQAVSAAALVAMIALTGAAWMTITVPAEAPEVVVPHSSRSRSRCSV